jgi:glutaminyl-tRNA synthetase
MASPIIVMRDPVLYRIQKMAHYRRGNDWVIYPMYDFAHCLSDSTEGITHSLCTLEFTDNRALYDWILDQLDVPCHPQQIEFARLNLTYTVMSKRILKRLVTEGHVSSWDDPRMSTLSGIRRRGYTPDALREFCEGRRHRAQRQHRAGRAARSGGQARSQCARDARDGGARSAARRDRELSGRKSEELEAVNNPEDPSAGTRMVPFSRVIYIEREDFMEDPPKKFFRLSPGKEVRLRYAYFLTCREVVKDAAGNVVELGARTIRLRAAATLPTAAR